MLAAQVNARKHDKLRMILGIAWSWGLCFCEALLCWAVIAVAAVGRGFGLMWVDYPPPPFACSLLSQTPPRRTIQAASVMQDPSHRSPCTSIYFGRKNYQKRIQMKYTFHSNELCKWVMQTGPGYTNRLCKWDLARSTLVCRRLYAASTELSHAQQSHGHPCPP